MTRSGRWLWCLAIGLWLLATSARAQEPTSGLAQVEAVAESIVAREETLSERAFDPAFRTKAKELLAALPLADLVAQTGEDGLGLNTLGDTQADLVYTPVTPCRIIDTRAAGGAIAAGATRSFRVTGTDYSAQGGKATGCGVPYGPTTAAVVNFVAVNPGGTGNLRVTPFGTTMPLASIINFSAGVNLANGLVVATCNPSSATCTSDITIQADVSATQLVADVQGYYQRVATGGVGTALLADAAVTAPKIGSGVVVRSLNSLTEAVTLAAGSNVSITPSGNTLTVSATPGGGGGDITAVNTPLTGGLQGGVTSGDANLRLVPCSATQLLKSDGTAWGCASDSDSGVNQVIGGAGITGSITARTLTLGSTATAANTAGALVVRDGTGSFLAGSIGLAGNLDVPNTTSATVGVLTKNGTPFLHNFGTENTFVGANAGNTTLTGTNNSAFGYYALSAATTGYMNSAFGYHALRANTTGYMNSAFGMGALGANTTAMSNSAFGNSALSSITIGESNAAFGAGTLWQLSSGYGNTVVGTGAGSALASGSENIYIGNATTGSGEESNTIRIGTSSQTATYIAGIYGQTSASGLAVYVASDGKLGTTGSSGSGDITAVNTPAGGGLQGGVTSGDANLGLLTCGSGQVLKSDGATWSCAADGNTGVDAVVGGGGVTGVVEGRTLTLGSTATAANTAGAIVARDGTGSLSAGSVGLAGNLDLPSTTSASVGVLTKGGTPFLHNFGTRGTFVGLGAGNFSFTGVGNSAFGYYALALNTTGSYNTGFGAESLVANTTGSQNSAFGALALGSNTIGNYNSAFGSTALQYNTGGSENSAFGNYALHANTIGGNNSAFGAGALSANTTGDSNSAFGRSTLQSNTTGSANAAFGYYALRANSTGYYNSAFGNQALMSNTTGNRNTAMGLSALQANAEASDNSAFGYQALTANTTGTYNSAFGQAALQANTAGSYVSAFGLGALQSNTTGYTNSAFGYQALYQLSSGDGNIGVGYAAGANLTSGSYNIIIGSYGELSESNTIRIGGTNQSTTYIAGIFGQTTASGLAVYVDSSGKLGTTTSSRRHKEQIADMDAESDVLLKLRPVSFYYRPELDETHLRQYGLVAEEVAEVAPGLVAYDKDGTPQTVRYHFVNAMLLNEVQKQRRQLETQDVQLRTQADQLRTQGGQLGAQELQIRDLKEQLARLEARLAQ